MSSSIVPFYFSQSYGVPLHVYRDVNNRRGGIVRVAASNFYSANVRCSLLPFSFFQRAPLSLMAPASLRAI